MPRLAGKCSKLRIIGMFSTVYVLFGFSALASIATDSTRTSWIGAHLD